MNFKNLFVTAIGTDIGKTVVSAILAKALNASYWKPVQSGVEEGSDSDKIRKLIPSCNIIPELYSLKAPLSPHAAAKLEGVEIDLDKINLPNLNGNLIVEGAGGLCVPLNNSFMIVDLIVKLNLPVVLVIKNYLGSINHSILSLELLKSKNLKLAAVFFVGESNNESEDFISRRIGDVRIYRVSWVKEVDSWFIEEQGEQLQLF